MITALLIALAPISAPAVPPASTTPRDVVLAMFDAFNRHDPAALARLYAPDAVLTSPEHCSPRGQRDVERSYGALFAEMPDVVEKVESMVVENDTVAVRFTATSRSAGLSIPIQAMIIVRDGLIRRDDAMFETGGRPCTP